MRLVVAAQAGILLLHRSTGYFPKLSSVLLYPHEYEVREEVVTENGLVEEVDEARAGESWQTGALVLAWDDVERDLESHLQNVVLHEFAHQLDAETGEMNGAPILADGTLRARWAGAMSAAYDRLVAAAERNEETLIDPYGAEDPAEFFAVATETFFLASRELAEEEPDLYAVLRDYYRQDPAHW
jgi:Mlc titration factor MtfA (ptsG expression regulator)